MGIEKIQAGEVLIEVDIQGDGKSIVLLPCAGGDISTLQGIVPPLVEAGFRTISVNPRGIGSSIGPLEDLTLHDMASDVAGVIEILDIAPVHIVGNALGNRVARCLAADRPELVGKLILVGAGGMVKPDPDAAAALQRLVLQGADMDEQEWKDAVTLSLLTPKSDPCVIEVFRQNRLWTEAILAQANAAKTPAEEWWTGGEAPMLVIQGLEDKIAPPGNGEILKEKLGERVSITDLPDVGHALLQEKPVEIAGIIIRFLRNQDLS